MPVDHTLNNRKADACAFKFIRCMKTLKKSKEFLFVLHIKASSIIAYRINVFLRRGGVTDVDDRVCLMPREFEGVR